MSKKVKNNIIKTLILLITVVVGILLYQTISTAWTSDDFPISVGMYGNDGLNDTYLVNNTNIYCIQRGARLRSTARNEFNVSAYISIKGNTATYNNVTTTNTYNGIMSYILSGGSWTKSYGTRAHNYYPRQVAIYNYWNTFVQNSGLGLEDLAYSKNPITDNETSLEIREAAERYASGENAAYQPVSIENVLGDVSINSNEIEDGKIGPFNIKYTGVPTITAYDANGNALSIEIYGSDKTTVLTQIPSNETFYIKATNNVDIAKVTVAVSSTTLSTEIWILTSNSGKQRLIAVNSETLEDSLSIDINVTITPVGDLTIIKQDADTSSRLSGMEFKLRTSNGTYVQKTSEGYNYDASFENATVFTITNNSGITITDLSTEYTYQVLETKVPNDDYVLSDQNGYDSSLNAVNLTGEGQWITLNRDSTQTVTYNNAARYISISGYVWLDNINKIDVYNNLWDDGNGEEDAAENRIAGVTVILRNKNGTEVARTTTDSNGEYIFDKENKYVRYNHIDEYYIEFDYSSIEITDNDGETRSGTEFIPAAFNSETISEIVDNGSRALMNQVPTNDEDLNGKATTYTGTNTSLEQIYGLSGNLFDALYNESTLTLEYINLGLKPTYDPDYEIKENLAYVKIVYNGYTYTYEYGAEEAEDSLGDSSVPTVKYQDSTDITLYSRPFYPSAIYDAITNGTDLQVYVVYGITIINTTTYNQEDIYQEEELNITSLTNTFDTTRYVLETNYADASKTSYEEAIQDDFANWSNSTDNGNETATTTYTGTIDGIAPGEYTTLFIQFRVIDNAIEEILQNPDGIFEENPTTATAQGYHTYTRLDYSWSNNISRKQTHYSKTKHRSSSAPYLVFELGEDDEGFVDRTVYGTVFEDGVVTTDGQHLGNGIFDSGEETVSGVTVELIDAETDSVATIYSITTLVSEDGTQSIGNIQGVPAETTTGDDGEFTFTGVTPGEYYIQLTYPNGDVYKSTIVTSEVAKNALGYDNNEYGNEWYKHLEGTNYSVAIDDLELRRDVNEADVEADMIANTAIIDVTIENTIENYTSEVIEVTNDDGTVEVYGVQYEDFEGFNLGIITQPTATVELEKLITNISLINTPTVILSGNPETGSMSGVSDLDGETNGGSTYTRVETAEENIYGSELTVTYTITITNISDINYYETEEEYVGWYYMFGEVIENVSVEVQIDPEEIYDYLDPELEYVSSNAGTDSPEFNIEEQTIQNEDGTETEVLVVTGLGAIERTEQKSFEISGYRVLSTQDDDMGYTNEVEIISLVNVTAEEDRDNDYAVSSLRLIKNPIVPEQAEAYITISPPTGADMMTPILYIITTAVMLVILAGVVIVIKKKVL